MNGETLESACVELVKLSMVRKALVEGFIQIDQDPPDEDTLEILVSRIAPCVGLAMFDGEIRLVELFELTLADVNEFTKGIPFPS